MSEKQIKKIPYGVASYERFIEKNCYYVDKTMYLETIEEAGDYLFFIRPRRFGKSLFLSVMEAYYDVFYKDRFEELFRETAIFSQPTKERGKYLVLKLNFSMVDPALEKVETSFLKHVQGVVLSFIGKYSGFLLPDREYFINSIKESRSASDILSVLVRLCRDSQQKIYAIIDEYDNFANTILSTVGEDAYQKLTRGEGFFRSFFNVLKGGTDGMGAPFTRLFLTGVSPITLDDVTSGYNIGKNISMRPHFNRMMGFTAADVNQMIEYYREMGFIKHPTGDLMEIITGWYGNYLFSEDDDIRLFNPDMVLYFIDNYMTQGKLPKHLIDKNVRIDYEKLRHLIIVDKGKGKAFNGNFDRLKQIIETGEISSEIEESFPLEHLTKTENFISLLFYFGLLTIKNSGSQRLVLCVPNETIRRLYYDYIKEGYDETNVFTIDLYTHGRLINEMAMKGEWKPFFEFITGRMRESMSLRDLITGEKSIQAFLNVYLGLSELYIVHAEKEMNKGYADPVKPGVVKVVMEPFLARYEGINYSYVLEIKYIKADQKRKPGEAKIQKLKAAAEEQLKTYSIDEKFRKNIEKTTLVKLVLIFCGHELVHIGAV